MAQTRTMEIMGKVSIDFMGKLKEYVSYGASFDLCSTNRVDKPIKLTETPSEIIVEFPVEEHFKASQYGQEKSFIKYETETFPRDQVSVRIRADSKPTVIAEPYEHSEESDFEDGDDTVMAGNVVILKKSIEDITQDDIDIVKLFVSKRGTPAQYREQLLELINYAGSHGAVHSLEDGQRQLYILETYIVNQKKLE